MFQETRETNAEGVINEGAVGTVADIVVHNEDTSHVYQGPPTPIR